MTDIKGTVRESDGIKWIDRGPTTDDHLAFTGHEAALIPFIKMLARPECAYINIGAHVGTWALRVAKFGLAHKVYAIEANPITYGVLKRNVMLNSAFTQDPTRIDTIQECIWDTNMQVVHLIDVKGMDSGGSTRLDTKGNGGVGYYTSTLDTLFPPGRSDSPSWKIGFIQMDVEGAEARVLRGAKQLLQDYRPNLLIELHEGHPGTDPNLRSQVYTELERHNYNYFSVNVAGSEEHLICRPAEEVEDFIPEIIQGTMSE